MGPLDSKDAYYVVDDDQIDAFIFTKEMTEHIAVYDKTVQIVGIVDNTEMRSKLMKFQLCNKSGDIIQFTIWQDEIIEEMKEMVVSGNIIYLDGEYARPKHKLSGSTVSFDLSIMSNTRVRVLKEAGSYVIPETCNYQPPTVEIEECTKHSGVIEVIGYIRNSICLTSLPNNIQINQGCLSDCQKYKVEVRMPVLCDMTGFKVGTHVRLRGTIKYSIYPYIWVFNKDDVKYESTEVRKVIDVLRGSQMPKRIKQQCENYVKKERSL